MPGGAEDVVAFGDVVGGLRLDVDAGDAGEEGCSFIERGGADVDGLIQQSGLRGGEGAEENAGLGRGAGTEFGDGDWRATIACGACISGGRITEARSMEDADELLRVGREDGALGAGEVVLRQGRDALKEPGADLVVEEPGWKRLLASTGRAAAVTKCLGEC
jgi:hypothetical protein